MRGTTDRLHTRMAGVAIDGEVEKSQKETHFSWLAELGVLVVCRGNPTWRDWPA